MPNGVWRTQQSDKEKHGFENSHVFAFDSFDVSGEELEAYVSQLAGREAEAKARVLEVRRRISVSIDKLKSLIFCLFCRVLV